MHLLDPHRWVRTPAYASGSCRLHSDRRRSLSMTDPYVQVFSSALARQPSSLCDSPWNRHHDTRVVPVDLTLHFFSFWIFPFPRALDSCPVNFGEYYCSLAIFHTSLPILHYSTTIRVNRLLHIPFHLYKANADTKLFSIKHKSLALRWLADSRAPFSFHHTYNIRSNAEAASNYWVRAAGPGRP